MNDEYYMQNLNRFVKSLPSSPFRFLFFSRDRHGWYPKLSTDVKMWEHHKTRNSEPYYIYPGVTSEYCYVYRKSDIDYDVYLSADDEVVAFRDSFNKYHKIIGGNTKIKAKWGNHYTIGLKHNLQNQKFFMMCHLTEYEYNKKENAYEAYHTDCDMLFQDAIHEKSKCFSQGHLNSRTLDWFQKVKNDPDAVAMFQALKQNIMRPVRSGGTFIEYQGNRYKVHKGPRGGLYIMIDNQKKYIANNRQVGGYSMYNENGFTDSFGTFLIQHLITKVEQKMPLLSDVLYVDDDGSKMVMIRYMQGNRSYIYEMLKNYVQDTYHIFLTPPAQRSVEQTRQLE